MKPSIRTKLLLALLSILLVSCASTQTFVEVDKNSTTTALVYFMRKKYPPYIHELRVIVNGKKLATIANNDFVAVNIPVGKNKILLEATDGQSFDFELPVEKPQNLYLLLTGEVEKVGQDIAFPYMTIHLEWRLFAFPINKEKAKIIANEFGKKLE